MEPTANVSFTLDQAALVLQVLTSDRSDVDPGQLENVVAAIQAALSQAQLEGADNADGDEGEDAQGEDDDDSDSENASA